MLSLAPRWVMKSIINQRATDHYFEGENHEEAFSVDFSLNACDRSDADHHPRIKPPSSGQRKLRRRNNHSAIRGRAGEQYFLLLDSRSILFSADQRNDSDYFQPV